MIEEIISREKWDTDSSLVFIITGSGDRTAISFNKNPSTAPKLHINYAFENSCDGEHLTINNSQISANKYQANQTISSNGFVGANDAVTFVAEQSITLNAGFEAKSGSEFHAYIASCEVNTLQNKIPYIHQNRTVISSLESTTNTQLSISPNPAADRIHIDYYLQEEGPTTLKVSDVNGKEITHLEFDESIKGWQAFPLDVSHLPEGIYFLTVQSNHQISSQRFVINSN